MATCAPCEVNFRACWPVFRSHCYSYLKKGHFQFSERVVVRTVYGFTPERKERTHVHIAVPTRAEEAHLVVTDGER